MAPKAKWTILTYIAAHNNLDEMGHRSLDQIIGVGSTDLVKHGVLFDGTRGAARYIVGDPGLVLRQEQLQNFDSGDPDRLIQTAIWIFEQCPAERYGLVLWSHGSGWQPEEIRRVARQARDDEHVSAGEAAERAGTGGSMSLFRSTLQAILKKDTPAERAICFDDGSGHSLDTLELDRITCRISERIDQPLDFLGMDACLMATLEVGFQLRRAVRYLVASEESVPGHSWPFDGIFGELQREPDRSPGELATSVVQQYTKYYRAHPPSTGDVTKVALDLTKIAILGKAVDALARALLTQMKSHANLLWKAQVESCKQESQGGKRVPNKFSYHLWDIRSVAERMWRQTPDPEVRESAQVVVEGLRPGCSVVLAEGHSGSWFDGMGGVSIYLVQPTVERISPYYPYLALSVDTQWDEMLGAYHAQYPIV